MKKKCIRYGSGLFIGLVAINTLVSCASTEDRLGIENASMDQAKQPLLTSTSSQQENPLLDTHSSSVEEPERINNLASIQINQTNGLIFRARNLSYRVITAGRQMPIREVLAVCEGAFVGAVLVGLPLGQYLSRLLLAYPSSCPQEAELLLPPFP